MNNTKPERDILIPFWAFLEFLKAEGFEINTGQYLNIYNLIERIDFNATPFEELKFIICPVLANTPEDQEKFYAAFDVHFALIEKKAFSGKKKPAKKQSNASDKRKAKLKSKKRKKFGVTLLIAFILLVGLGLSYSYLIKPILPTPEVIESPKISSQKKNIVDLFAELLNHTDLNTETLNRIKLAQQYFNENDIARSANEIYYLQSDANRSETYYNTLRALSNQLDYFRYDNPYNSNFAVTFPDVEIYLSLILIISFLLFEYHKSQNQSFIAELEQGKKPPYVWQFNLNHKPKIVWDGEIYQTAHHLRKRVTGDELDFDIDRTIQETINHGGLLELTYKPRSKPSEYIALIDKSSLQSHQASFFSFLANEFAKNDIHIEQFFYQDNMMVFWHDSANLSHFTIEDLTKLFPKYRILIFGNAHELLDAKKGTIKNYAHALKVWSDIAILTPRQSADWDYKEKILSQHFVVLPATSSGLIEIIDTFEGIKSTQLGAWKFDHASENIELPDDPVLGVKHLSYQLSSEVFRWLCICAVYPQLFWDLTLYLGDTMFPDKPIISQQNILELLKISWFNTGFIPLEYRQELMARLDQQTLDVVRTKIVEEMRKNPPKRNTHAYDEYKLNLLVNELLIKDLPNEQKKAIKREIKNMERHVDFSHYTEIKAISPTKKTSTLDFILPEELQSFLNGSSWKHIFRRTALFLFIAFIGVYFFSSYIYKVIDDDKLFETVAVLVCFTIYCFAFYRFMRKRSILNSFEVAFYWLFISIGFAIVFVGTVTVIIKLPHLEYIENLPSPEDNSFVSFFILFFLFTIPLIFNQIKKGINGIGVAMFYISNAFSLFMLISIVYDLLINTSIARLTISIFGMLFFSVIFWAIRFVRRRSIDLAEIGIYYTFTLLLLILYCSDKWETGVFIVLMAAIGLLFVFKRKWKFFEFVAQPVFSIFWMGISSSLLIIFADSFKSSILLLATLILTVILYLNSWYKTKTLDYQSSIYAILIVISLLVFLIETDITSSDKTIFMTCNLIATLFLVVSFWVRKYSIHTIELLVFWTGLMLLSAGTIDEYNLGVSLTILFNAATAVGFIVYKIKSHKKLREAYDLNP